MFALEDIITRLKSQGVTIHLVIKNKEIYEQLEKLKISEQIGRESIFYLEEEAIEHAMKLLKSNVKTSRKFHRIHKDRSIGE